MTTRIGRIGSAVLAAAFLGSCGESLPPQGDPGLWETTITIELKPGQGVAAGSGRSTLCVDAEMAARMRVGAAKTPNCSKRMRRFSGGRLDMASECSADGAKLVSQTTGSGDFKRSYVLDNHLTVTPPTHGMAEAHTHTVARWLGPCPNDMAPGDRVMENGVKVKDRD